MRLTTSWVFLERSTPLIDWNNVQWKVSYSISFWTEIKVELQNVFASRWKFSRYPESTFQMSLFSARLCAGLSGGQINEPCSLATKVPFGALRFCNTKTWDLQRPEFCWREAHHTQEAITFNAKWHPLLAFGHVIVLSLPFCSYIWELESTGQLGMSLCKAHKNICHE